MMCACEKGACIQNRDSFVCMSRGLPQCTHWGSSLTQPGDCITHNISELFLKKRKPLIRNSFKGPVYCMLGHNLSIQTRCFQRFEYCTVSVQVMHTSCAYGAPRRFDNVDVFRLAPLLSFQLIYRSVGMLFCWSALFISAHTQSYLGDRLLN